MDSTKMLAYASDETADRDEKRPDEPASRDKSDDKAKKKPLSPNTSSDSDTEPATTGSSGGGG